MEENLNLSSEPVSAKIDSISINNKALEDEAIDVTDTGPRNLNEAVISNALKYESTADVEHQMLNGAVRTLDGEIAGDEFTGDAINYQILLGKIDALLERLKLDA